MISIRLRIILLAIFSIGMVVLFISHQHIDIQKKVDNSNISLNVVNEVTAISKLIHSLQKERGLTAIYLIERNKEAYENMAEQRKKSDEVFEKLINFFKTNDVVDILKLQKQIMQTRSNINKNKVTWLEVKFLYTSGIEQLLMKITLLLSELEHSKEVTHQLYSLIHLAKAREKLGSLRANMSHYYQRGEITREELLDISKIYGGFINEFNSFYFHIQRTEFQEYKQRLKNDVFESVNTRLYDVLHGTAIEDKIIIPQSVVSTWWREATFAIDLMKEVENNILKLVQENSKQTIIINKEHLNTFIFQAIAMLIIIIILTITTVFRILQALSILIRSMNTVEETQDFGVRVQPSYKDEFGQLGFSINKLLDYTDQIVKEKDKLASIDLLTGVMNRRSFLEVVEKEVQRSNRYNIPLSLIFCDIDKFKPINDKYGHAVGDRALQAFANVLQSEIRSSDYVARWGGEEFVILVSENNSTQAAELAEKLRKSVMSLSVPPIEQMTCSFGVAQIMKGESFKQLCNRADAAVYKAKELGRNQVCFADETVAKN
jgi:diguanylate cyclase (GGDEF)-like protein